MTKRVLLYKFDAASADERERRNLEENARIEAEPEIKTIMQRFATGPAGAHIANPASKPFPISDSLILSGERVVPCQIVYLPHYVGEKMRYAKPGDAGFDLRAAIPARFCVPAAETRIIACGFKIAIPFGFELQIRPRSGLALKYGVTVLNSPGTVDAGYRDEICALLHNTTRHPFWIEPGDRIAQAVLAPVFKADFEEVDALPESERSTAGWGSSGVK